MNIQYWQRADIDKIEKINRRAARFVTSNFHCTSSVSSMINRFGWRQLQTRRQNSCLCFLFKILHNLTSAPLGAITTPNSTIIESFTTRRSHANNVFVPFTRTDTYQHSFRPDVCNNWNKLPNYVKEITSLEQFKDLHVINCL